MKSIASIAVVLGGFVAGVIGAVLFVSLLESAGIVHGPLAEIMLLILYMIGVLNAMLFLSLNNTMKT